jgi:soluble lytic murein transglycosylase
MALAALERAAGRTAAAAAIVRQVWREEDLTPYQEASILREFGEAIGRDDHKFRADRMLYKEQTQNALREAALAGPDVLALAKARAAVIANAPSDALINAVPKTLADDPGLTFTRIQKARRSDHIGEAADLLLSAPRDPARIVDGDQWWVERRIIARKLLDRGAARLAYRICAEHAAASAALKIEAEFHAGWIALRFLGPFHPRRDAGRVADLEIPCRLLAGQSCRSHG